MKRREASRMKILGLVVASAVATVAAPPPAAHAAEVVGSVALVREWAYTTPRGGARSPVFVRDGIEFGALLETVRDGALHVRFVDESELRIGSDTRLEVDELVYDPTAGEETLAVKITLGALRFVSGRIAAERVTIETPVATVGLRGTDVITAVADSGETYVGVRTGRVAVTARVSGVSATLAARSAVTVSADGRTITPVSRRGVPAGLGGAPGDSGYPTGAGGGGDSDSGTGGGGEGGGGGGGSGGGSSGGGSSD